MSEKYNLKSIIAGLVVLVVGIVLVITDLTWWKVEKSWVVNVGCSLIASSLVILMTTLFVERVKDNPLEPWGISKIYRTRAKMNEDCSVSMNKAKYQVDVIAFGLKSYRTEQERLTKKLLQKGVNFRILTMDPSSPFISQREKEENENEGQIKNTINQLVKWANNQNKQSNKGKIVIKGYSCMTLNFYWRVDDDLYIGPYWYGRSSQQTISYKYNTGAAFDLYTEYYEELWNDENLSQTLTDVKDVDVVRKRN